MHKIQANGDDEKDSPKGRYGKHEGREGGKEGEAGRPCGRLKIYGSEFPTPPAWRIRYSW